MTSGQGKGPSGPHVEPPAVSATWGSWVSLPWASGPEPLVTPVWHSWSFSKTLLWCFLEKSP